MATTTSSSPMMNRSLEKAYLIDRPGGELPITQADIVSKSIYALAVTVAATMFNVYLGFTNPGLMYALSIAGGLGTIVLAFVMFFVKKNTSNIIWTTIHAVLQGLVVGGFTFGIGIQTMKDGTPGWSLVSQAVIGSVCVFIAAFALYALGIIRPSERFRSIFSLVLLGMMMLYTVNFIMAITIGHNFLMAEGPFPIIFAAVAIVLASIRVITDIQDCDYAISRQYPKQSAWSLASSVVASLIWLYVEILRLLYLVRRD